MLEFHHLAHERLVRYIPPVAALCTRIFSLYNTSVFLHTPFFFSSIFFFLILNFKLLGNWVLTFLGTYHTLRFTVKKKHSNKSFNRKFSSSNVVEKKKKLTWRFGGQWSRSSNMCLIFWASWITKFNSISNSPPTSCNKNF